MESIKADLCVVGAGSGGLSVAAAGAQLGLSTVLIEGGEMGGDCLNSGCVPSKALIAAANSAIAHRRGHDFGIDYNAPQVDFVRVGRHVREVIAAIAPHDSQERYEGLGARVVRAKARFTGPDRLVAGEIEVIARRFCIATGSLPMVPPIPGLDRVSYHTNLDIFDLPALPDHLLILGGGPIGCELGQAFRRLGARVTIVEMMQVLGRDDPELVEVLRQSFRADGIEILEGTKAVAVSPAGSGIRLTVENVHGRSDLEGSHLLVAVGRVPAIPGLGLDAAGVRFGDKGIAIDDRCRTTSRRIYAIGDVAGAPQFTHWASHQASVVVKAMMFRLPARMRREILPAVTFTDPELAQVGLTEATARAAGHKNLAVQRWPFSKNDRAEAERRTEGLVKIVATTKGRVLGVGIVGAHAGELIQAWSLALASGLTLRAFTDMITAYPTLGDASKRAASNFYVGRLFSSSTRRLVRLLARFP